MIEKEKSVKSMANPTPLGLASFSFALLMISFVYSTVIGLTLPVIAIVLTLGFIAPAVAAIVEFVKGNTFRATTISVFSLFFLSLYLIYTNPFGTTLAAAEATSMGIFHIIWALVTLFLLAASIIKSQMKHWMQAAFLIGFALFNIVMSIGYFTGSSTVFIVASVFGFLTTLIIFVDFIFHLILTKPRN